MKLKQRPDDFQVEELTTLVPGDRGPFALYRLEKRGWTTPDAVQQLRRRWKLAPQRVAFAGLKDRHAATVQYLTIFQGPRRDFRQEGIEVRFLGYVFEPCASHHIRANQFRITLRELHPDTTARAEAALTAVGRDGLPNYFDDQRFGSVQGHGTFVARYLIDGQFEAALRFALTAPYEYDRAADRRAKQVLTHHWGDWAACYTALPPGEARTAAAHLAHHPGDFQGAITRLNADQRGLHLSVYQSHLWNKLLGRWLEIQLQPGQRRLIPLRLGEFPFPIDLDNATREELANLQLPLPSARLHLDATDPRLPTLQAVLAEEGLELRQLRVKGVRSLFFSKGERAAHIQPGDLTWVIHEDDLHHGQRKLALAFTLPRGAYATLLVKRLQVESFPQSN